MASIDVDVDPDIFDDDELIEELEKRVRRLLLSKDKRIDRIRECARLLNEALSGDSKEIITISKLSILDEMKINHVMSVIDKYSVSEIETILK